MLIFFIIKWTLCDIYIESELIVYVVCVSVECINEHQIHQYYLLGLPHNQQKERAPLPVYYSLLYGFGRKEKEKEKDEDLLLHFHRNFLLQLIE